MTNKLLFTVIAILIVVAAIVVIFAYTYLDIGLTSREGGTLRVALQSFSAETLDPSIDNKDGLNYHGHMYDHLAGVNSEGRLDTRFGLINGWEVNPSADSFTLTLRENALWHDGNTVASEDVRSSLNYYFRDDAVCGVCGNVKQAIDSMEIVDDRNVTLHLTKPDVVFMGLFASIEGDIPLLPAHVISGAALQSEPIGSGPWRFAEKSDGASIEYEVNRDYWNTERISTFDRLSISLVSEESERIALIQTDKIDIVPIGVSSIDAVKGSGFAVDGPKNVLSTALRFFMSYDENYLTSNLDFRKALAVSVDMADIVGATFPSEAASVATGSALFTPVSPGYVQGLSTYVYDPEEAQALLRNSGYAGETVNLMSLVAYGISEMPRINEMIVEDWRAVGINAQILPVEWPAVQPLFMPRPQMFDEYAPAPVLHGAAPARPGGDINSVRRYLSGADNAMLTYFDPDVADAMIYQLEVTADDDERALILQALNRKTYAEFWAIPILWRHDTYAVSPSLIGWMPANGTSSDLRFETIRRTQ